jgi:Rrf2 family iron-sulfur cluster assembly transcriptional regulator
MRLSTKGRYAVMAMADLAKNGRGAGGEGAPSPSLALW